MAKIDLDLTAYELKFIFPDLHISTTNAYRRVNPNFPKYALLDLIEQPIENWKSTVKNDFENSAFKKHPELSKMKANLYADGAIFASMTGSGSVLYGVFVKFS